MNKYAVSKGDKQLALVYAPTEGQARRKYAEEVPGGWHEGLRLTLEGRNVPGEARVILSVESSGNGR